MNTKRVVTWLLALIMGSAIADSAPRAPVWRTLAPFESAREFDRYRNSVREAAKQQGLWWGSMRQSWRDHPLLAQNEVPCDPGIMECPDETLAEEVLVTGLRASTRNSAQSASALSITNNQVSGVDEGDIVKAFDRFFIVLHEGRLYSVDTGAGSGTLRVADRVDAYQSAAVDSWIDEILIQDDIVLVTGYSYQVEAATIALFRVDRQGTFRFLARYFIESNDYFSGENYASRIVDGKLVIYTPLYLPDVPEDGQLPIPRIRSWTAERGYSEFQPLFGVTDLYHPVQRSFEPALHVISVCPIRERTFRCESRGIVGPWQREMYVANDDVYLWLSGDDSDADLEAGEQCRAGRAPFGGRGMPSAVYRVPIGGGEITGVLTAGKPHDQFAFEQRGGYLWGLVAVEPIGCEGARPVVGAGDPVLQLARIPLWSFSGRPSRLGNGAWFAVPQIGNGTLQTRYAADYLLYGEARGSWLMSYDEAFVKQYFSADGYGPGGLVVVPLDAPRDARTLPLAHGVERVELFGAHALAFGYADRDGMRVSAIGLDREPRVAGVALLPGVAEAEGRSHAFNGLAQADGSGIFGLPTVDLAMLRTGRWREMASDVTFVTADAALHLATADELEARPDSGVSEDYECEVSCFDWYGSSRPIFFRGRIFALTGREVIEGTLSGGRVVEIARLNLAGR